MYYVRIVKIIFGILNINKYFCFYEPFTKKNKRRSKYMLWKTMYSWYKNLGIIDTGFFGKWNEQR